jgi:hypothetical protein
MAKRGRSKSATPKKGKRRKVESEVSAVKESHNTTGHISASAAVEKADTTVDVVALITTTKSVDTSIKPEDDIDIFLSPNMDNGVNVATKDNNDIYADETLVGSDDSVEKFKAEDNNGAEYAFDIKLTDDEPDTVAAVLQACGNHYN